jgi:hypothetical protein
LGNSQTFLFHINLDLSHTRLLKLCNYGPLEAQFSYMIKRKNSTKAQHLTRGFLKYSLKVST